MIFSRRPHAEAQRRKGAEFNFLNFFNFLSSFAPPRLCVMLLAVIFFSCQTAPRMPDISLDGGLPLEPGGYVYIIAEQGAMPVLSQFMLNDSNNNQFQQIVDMTRLAAAAVYVTTNGETGKAAARYRLAAWGNYPASRAKMAMGSSKEWKKRRSAVSGADYWYSPQRGYAVAVTAGMALVATAAKSDEEPPDPYSIAPGTALPEGFAAFHKGSILSLWLNNPAALINQKLGEMGIPIEIPAEQLFVGLLPEDGEQYVVRLQIQVAGATQARALAMVFAFARNFIPPPLSVLFANPPAQDGSNLTITTPPLSAREIALLLKMFSL
jgi:hypothetical protein